MILLGHQQVIHMVDIKIKNLNLKCVQNIVQTFFYNQSLKIIYVKSRVPSNLMHALTSYHKFINF
jgi:hypothetical protein